MKKNTEIITTGWKIPISIKDSFVEFCARVDTHVQSDCAGALFIWQYLPAQIREWAKLAAKGEPVVDIEFWKGFREGARSQIAHLLENHGQKVEPHPLREKKKGTG